MRLPTEPENTVQEAGGRAAPQGVGSVSAAQGEGTGKEVAHFQTGGRAVADSHLVISMAGRRK